MVTNKPLHLGGVRDSDFDDDHRDDHARLGDDARLTAPDDENPEGKPHAKRATRRKGDRARHKYRHWDSLVNAYPDTTLGWG